MNFKPFLITLACLGLITIRSEAQNNLTGRWEGVMDGEFIQLNIEHTKTRFCVYSYDFVLGQENTSFCRATYKTYFLDKEGAWFIRGNRLIANSGSHNLMQMKIWRSPGDAPNKLRASIASNGVNLVWHDDFSKQIILTKLSKTPMPIPGQTGVCEDSPKEKKQEPIEKPAPKPKPQPTPVPKPKPPVPKTPVPEQQPEPPAPKPNVPKPKTEDNTEKLKQMNARKQSEQSRLIVHVKEISLKLYDNGVVDNDIISVFYNGRLLVSNQKLSEQAIELKIKLDENTAVHEITLYAENLGEIPPNTALIIVTAGKKRYELRSKADLQENAVLVFEYKPE